jgi:hypothetical protein
MFSETFWHWFMITVAAAVLSAIKKRLIKFIILTQTIYAREKSIFYDLLDIFR